MEASPLPTSEHDNWAQQFAESLESQRDRVREFLAIQHERLSRAENELAEQLQQIGDELAQDRSEARRAKGEIEQRSEQLAREIETLEGLKQELEARQAEWEQLQQRARQQQEALAEQIRRQQDELDRRREELDKRRPKIDAAEAKLHHDRREFDLARQEHQAESEQLDALKERLEAKQGELDAASEELASQRSDTESQRRRIAREFKDRHAAHLRELERRRAELQQRDTAEQEELDRQLAAAQRRGSELAEEVESLRNRCSRLEREPSQGPADGGISEEALGRVEAERDALLARIAETEERLAEAERRAEEAAREGTPGQATDADLARRYELAMEDVRELKKQNAELQRELAQAPTAAPPAAAAGGGLDWEAEKRRILASLESDFEEDDEEAQAERLKIEEVIQATDRALAEKDQEIEELQQLLEDQSTNVGSVAVGAAAFGEVLDNDAIIQEERENLRKLQEEWQEKLRKAEVDISVERARMARERAEIDEKLRTLESQSDKAGGEGKDKSGKPVRGRWLAQLGLKDSGEE